MTRQLTTLAIALAATFALVADASAKKHKLFVNNPQPAVQPYVQPVPMPVVLPKFGFQSYNLSGVGERVTYVRCHGLASQMGLEPGDTILSLNGFPLTYHGAWNQALQQAVYQGGAVQLAIRDVNTGYIVYRTTYIGGGPGIGPITPKTAKYSQPGPIVSHNYVQPGAPVGVPGPITQKSVQGGENNNLSPAPQWKVNNQSIKQLGQLLKIGE